MRSMVDFMTFLMRPIAAMLMAFDDCRHAAPFYITSLYRFYLLIFSDSDSDAALRR